MLKYVDFWYALKTTKNAQTILEGFSMETTKARAVSRNKVIIMLQDSSLFVARSIFNLSEITIQVADSVQHKKGLIGLTCIKNKALYIGNSDIVIHYSSKLYLILLLSY